MFHLLYLVLSEYCLASIHSKHCIPQDNEQNGHALLVEGGGGDYGGRRGNMHTSKVGGWVPRDGRGEGGMSSQYTFPSSSFSSSFIRLWSTPTSLDFLSCVTLVGPALVKIFSPFGSLYKPTICKGMEKSHMATSKRGKI